MMTHEPASNEALVEVLVIGAGAAGIAAARTLHAAETVFVQVFLRIAPSLPLESPHPG